MKENGVFFKGVFCGACVMAIVGGLTFAAKDKVAEWIVGQESKGELHVNLDAVEEKISQMEGIVNEYYLDEIDTQEVENQIYKGMIEGLGDDYAEYYTEEELAKVQESNSGVYNGIGVALTQDAETGIVTVVSCYEGTPAWEAGVLAGDVIYAVDDVEVTGKDLTETVARIKKNDKDTVKLTVARDGESDYLEFDVERDDVEVPTVSCEMLNEQVGYIAISSFDQVTEEQFLEAKEELEEQGMEKLIVDLRNNLGGVLDTVCNILDEMLPEGIIVYTEDKNGERTEYKSDGEHSFDLPLVVLVNEYSASASEIFAGAVKDYGIGTLVGTTTYGKGIVQRLFSLPDGTAVKMTIAKYYTPDGNDIHKVGIEPDVEVKLDDSLRQKSVISKEEDNQIQKALEVLEGK